MEKYTVIIPTCDRAETLQMTIRTCLRQTYPNFEIIVSDNCSVDNTKEIVEQFKDQRIRYINPGRRLSMSGNFEFAQSHVTDGFVMIIGADDGIMPDAIHYVDSIVQKYKVDAVSCQQATYVWPNFPDPVIAGRLTFGGARSDIEIRDSHEWIQNTLSFQRQYCFDLPNLYCGFVHKRVIDKAYKDGQYYRSCIPDAYSAFATAIFVDRYAFSHRPFSIAGQSAKSTGASVLSPVTDNEASNKFWLAENIPLCTGFVNFPSFEMSCAEPFAQLALAFPDLCAPYSIDYKTMLQNALKNANSKTLEAVSKGVKVMAKNFSVDIDDGPQKNNRAKIPLPQLLVRKLRSLTSSLSASSRIDEIRKSERFGIKDIDDAALVAHLLMQLNDEKISIANGRKFFCG